MCVRSIFVVALFLVCFVGGVVSQRPVDHAIVEIFSDNNCLTNVTDLMVIPGPFARRCQPEEARRSRVHFCAEEDGQIRYAYNVWQPSGDCSGDPGTSVTSYGYNGRCSQGVVMRGGNPIDVSIRVQCVFASHTSLSEPSTINKRSRFTQVPNTVVNDEEILSTTDIQLIVLKASTLLRD